MSASQNNRAFKSRPDQQYPLMMERRPRMLKDFLTADDSSSGTSNSCSSSGFNSVPRRRHQLHSPPPPLRRSRSRAAASATISALHAVVSAVKRFHSPKSTAAILPRRRSKKEDRSHDTKKLTVTIKDIIRWRSFRDVAEDESPAPLVFDSPPPPRECTAASLSSSTGTTTTSSTPCSSSGSSWCDSDFTAEELPCWDGNSHNSGKKFYGRVGAGKLEEEMGKSTVKLKVGPEDSGYDEFEDEQQQLSPISVLEYEEDGIGSAPPRSSSKLEAKWEGLNLENVNSRSAAGEEEDSEVEGRMARRLVEHVKATTTSAAAGFCLDSLLLGFFTEALSSSDQVLGFGQLNQMIEEAESWILNAQQGKSPCPDLGLEDRSSSGSWVKFREEQQEEAVRIQTWITNLLLHEILDDLFSLFPTPQPSH